MILSYIITALRAFKLQKQHFALNVFGLSVGLAAAILVALFAVNELSYDAQQPDAERVYRVGQDFSKLGLAVIPISNYTQAKNAQSYSQIEDVFALTLSEQTQATPANVTYRSQGYKLDGLLGATPACPRKMLLLRKWWLFTGSMAGYLDGARRYTMHLKMHCVSVLIAW